MNYILKVDTCNVDKVVLKLTENDITIKNVLRSVGSIYVQTKFLNKLKLIGEILEVKQESRIFANFLSF